MTIAVLDSIAITEGDFYTVPSSVEDRLLVMVAGAEAQYSYRTLEGATFGGLAFETAVQQDATKTKGGVYFIREANIPTGSNEMLGVWTEGVYKPLTGRIYTLLGVDQTNPVAATNTVSAISEDTTSLAITTSDNSLLMGLFMSYSATVVLNQAATSAATLPLVLSYSDAIGHSSWYSTNCTSDITTGAAETIVADWSGTNLEGSVTAAVFKPAVTTTTETLDNVTLEPAAGKQFVTIGATPDLTYKSLLFGTDPAAVTGDQLESGTVTSDGKAVTLNADGTFSIANVGTNVQTFNYRVYDMDGDGWSAMATATVTPELGPDTTKPVITLIGDNPAYIGQNAVYTDAGANVTDNVDAGSVLVASGSVDTATLGSYTLTYNYTDAAGNVADTVTRTVEVIGANPVITLNGSSTVFVDINAAYTDAGATWTDAVDGSGSVTAAGTVDTSTVGTYTLTYDHTDTDTNAADTVYRSVVVRDPDEVTANKSILRSIWTPII